MYSTLRENRVLRNRTEKSAEPVTGKKDLLRQGRIRICTWKIFLVQNSHCRKFFTRLMPDSFPTVPLLLRGYRIAVPGIIAKLWGIEVKDKALR
jgi:hypothetical protein